jgi:hypothetical protein
MSASIQPRFNSLPEIGVQQRLSLVSGQLHLGKASKNGKASNV